MIGKFPIRLDQNRQLGEAIGAYEREVHFYSELADRVPIRQPRCYYAAMDPNPMAGREDEMLALLDRLPRWLVRLLVPLGLLRAARSKRRYALLLEDLAPARLGDQVAGCDRADAELALRELARVHAHWWQHPDLATLTWAPRINALTRYMDVLYRKSMPGFFENLGAERSPEFRAFAHWLTDNGVPAINRLGLSPQTLLHSDYRLDNLFFHDGDALAGDGSPRKTLTAFDWQTVTRGPAAFDVAYFITGNLRIEDARCCEEQLLRGYHQELTRLGVDDFSFERLLEDYELSKLFIVYRIILSGDMLDFSDKRGTLLIKTWLERLQALIPDDYEALADRALRGGSSRRV